MTAALAISERTLSPWLAMGAYEAFWAQAGTTFKRMREAVQGRPDALVSDLVFPAVAERAATDAREMLRHAKIEHFGVRVRGDAEYPDRLRASADPILLLYFQGWWDLMQTRSVAVVGTRNPSDEGKRNTRKLVEQLVADGFTIASGLAKGIDTIAHRTAIDSKGWTIGVIGTPLSRSYPMENRDLQRFIAREHLLISQVPVIRYSQQGPEQNKLFFPARNITMSAISEATIIVEAGETSGTQVQARAALQQGRKLFIFESCFRGAPTWLKRLESQGATRVKSYEDIKPHLAAPTS